MSFNETLIYALIGFILGFVIQYVVLHYMEKNNSNITLTKTEKISKEFFSGVVVYLISLIILNTYTIQYEISSINNKIDNGNSAYEKARKYILNQSDDDKEFYELKLKNIDEDLNNISKGDLMLNREEMYYFWEKGFIKTNAGEEVLATNEVSKKDWTYFGPNGDGDKIQCEAINRGVIIKRVMLMGDSNLNNEELISLGKFQKNRKIDVKKIQNKKLDEELRIRNYLDKIGNCKDFVIFGDRYLLLTYVDNDFKIKKSILTTDKEKINSAKEVYKWIWNNSDSID